VVTLEASKLFSHLPAAERAMLLASARGLNFKPGQEIFKEGEPGDGVYVVKSGRVEISALLGSGKQQAFSHVVPGDFFGEMAVLDKLPRSACAVAIVETDVYFVPREQLITLLTRSPDLCMTLLQEISRRIREFNQQYIREVLQAERMAVVGRFASTIVHDLKNPLTIVGVSAEIAGQAGAAPELRRDLSERINRQVDRITGMVNDILEFTRGTPSEPVFAPTDYRGFVQSVVDELEPDVARKAVSIELAPPPAGCMLRINPPRLSRVFFNLVLNAADAMTGGGTVRLRFHETNTELVTEVEDTGNGIAAEIIDNLFEPFATFGKVKGTGLGLAICRRIVEEHGGKIWASNQPEGGALLAFALPKPKEGRGNEF
jgi:signal transduction histidine kinase